LILSAFENRLRAIIIIIIIHEFHRDASLETKLQSRLSLTYHANKSSRWAE